MKKSLTIGIVLVVLGALALAFSALKKELPAPISETPSTQTVETYTAPAYGLTFVYPESYYLQERNAGTAERPQLSIVLVEDTEENRAVLRGESEVPREGPTSITVDVYQNPDELPAEDWVQGDTNWMIRTSEAAPLGTDKITGVTYTWSGLYEGRSIIATRGRYAYVFSVTWMSPEDPILDVFEELLRTITITDAATSA